MKIAVCISHVPDTETKVTVAEDGKSLNPQDVSYILSPYDEFAVEEALKFKEEKDAEVVVITVGSDDAKESIKKALAMGADSAVLLKTEKALDTQAIAKELAKEIKSQNAEIVFFGKQSIDYDNAVMGQLTAAMLEYNCVSVVVDLKIEDSAVTAEREIEGGKEVVKSELPIVITAQKGLNEPRYPSLKGIMKAKKKPVEEKESEDHPPLVETLEMKKPSAKQPGKIIGEDASVVPELVRLLKEEAKVI